MMQRLYETDSRGKLADYLGMSLLFVAFKLAAENEGFQLIVTA
jgi:hypothetical protein